MKNNSADKLYHKNATRNGKGLEVFIDFPRHLLHMKNEEKDLRYYLMYFSEVENDALNEASTSDVVTMYDNSFFEYQLEGRLPDMNMYIDNIAKYRPDIVMVDTSLKEYHGESWGESVKKILAGKNGEPSFKLMAIPHGETLEDMSALISKMNMDDDVDIIGIPYKFNGFTRMDVIAYCMTNGTWCWETPVHLLGLSDSNEISDHHDLIRICQNIISVDTSFPVLLACEHQELQVDVSDSLKFVQPKPATNILTCNTENINENLVRRNIMRFKQTIKMVTSGYAKIAFVGAAGSGKTSTVTYLANMIRRKWRGNGGSEVIVLKYPPFHEVCDYREEGNADLVTALCTGCNIMSANIAFDKTSLLDRCVIDNIAYAKLNDNAKQVKVFTDIFNKWGCISSIALVCPLDSAEIEDDGKRITDREQQLKLHQLFEETLSQVNMCGVSLVKLGGDLSIQSRVFHLLKSI